MKKLLTFAGVSALALITAAPDAFAAAGTYNPQCKENVVTITFYGMKAPDSGTDPELTSFGTAKFSGGKWYKSTDDELKTPVTTFGGLGLSIPEITKSISFDGIDATKGAKPFRADLKGTAPTGGTNQKTPETNTLTGTSTCANASPATSMGVASSSTLPTTLGDIENRTSLAYVVMYAANCANTANATCSLTVGTNKSATYNNTCSKGYGGAGNTNWATMTCAEELVSTQMPANPGNPTI